MLSGDYYICVRIKATRDSLLWLFGGGGRRPAAAAGGGRFEALESLQPF